MCLFTNCSSCSACIMVLPLYPFDLPFFPYAQPSKVTICNRHVRALVQDIKIAEAFSYYALLTMLWNEFDIAKIEALWLSRIEIRGIRFTSIFSVFSVTIICDPLSENPHSSHNFCFFFIFSVFCTVLKSEFLKFQLNQASSFEVIALDSRVSKKIDLYSNHTESKLQTLTFTAITLVCICLQCWDLRSSKCSPVICQTIKL